MKPICLIVAVSVIFSAGSVVLGQGTSAPSAVRDDGTPINPAHEQAKNDAEKSYQKGDYKRAIELTSTVILENPNDHVAYYLRGSARVEFGLRTNDVKLVRQGITDTRESIRVQKGNNVLYYLPYLYGMTTLATMENRKEHAEVAIKVADQIIETPNLKPEEKANLFFQRGNTRMFLEEFDKAAADFDQTVRTVPTHMGGHIALAEAYARSGNVDKALAAFTKTVEQFPKNPLVYNNRGMFLQQQDKHQEAVLDFTRAIEADPQYFYAMTNRAFSLIEMGDYKAAEADLSESLRINPRQPIAFGLRATTRLAMGNTAGALQDHEAALKIAPKNPIAHADLGFVKFYSRDFAGALVAFDQAVRLDKTLKYLEPWRFWSMTLAGRGAGARTHFGPAGDRPADSRDWVDHLMFHALGKIDDARLLATMNKTNQEIRNAQACEAYFFIGLQKEARGDATGAQDAYRKALETKAKQLSAYRGADFALRRLTKGS